MSTTFPTAIDVYTNPTPTSKRNSPSLAQAQTDQNDAIIANETKIGTGNSTATSGKLLRGTGAGTSAWDKTAPAGAIVGDTDSQTLTNKTISTGSALDANADPNFTYHALSRQALINGNFDIWQRAITSNSYVGVLTCDRFGMYGTADGGTYPTLTQSRQVVTPEELPGSFYHFRLAPNGAGTSLGANSLLELFQKIENGARLLAGSGKQVTLSFMARSSITGKKIGCELGQNYGTGGTPTAGETINGESWTLTSTWTRYSHTFTTNTLSGKTFGTDNNDFLAIEIWFQWGASQKTRVGAATAEDFVGSGTIDIAQIQLCAGSAALPFQPKSFSDELEVCQRYYEKSYPYATAVGASLGGMEAANFIANGIWYSSTVTASTDRRRAISQFKVSKRATPTVVYYDLAGTASKVTSLDTNGAYVADGITETYQAVAANTECVYGNTAANLAGFCCHWTASAEL